MISKNIYFNILIRVLFIVILSALLGYLMVEDKSLRISIVCFLLIILLTVNLVSYLNTTNKKISYFFNSVRNDDSSLSFPENEQDRHIREIYAGMNRVNQQIKQLKIENNRQEQYFGILLEHLATGIITFDDKGFILHANSSAKKLLSMEVLTHLRQIERKDAKLYNIINSIKPFERKLIAITTEQGEVQLSLKATSFRTNDKEMVILSVQDIKNELDEKEIESWMKLIRVLMHEIMNSITPITSLSESLSNIYFDAGQPITPELVTHKTITTTVQGLKVIKEQGRGLMSFVDSYRKLTRVPEPEKKLFKVVELLNRVQILYNSLDRADSVSFSFSLKDPDIEIYADQNLISLVLINLLKNALEANENNPDGKITIIAGLNNDYQSEICVTDNGPGITEANLEEIFVPFFTTREKGSGIGLSISRQIMKAHGGNLKVRSIPGKETVFCLTFQS